METSFTALDWSYTTNIYEVNLRQYTAEGTFDAFAKELPRLRDMGVEILWFMPITPISLEKRLGTLGSYYACADYTATNPEFGSVDDFRSLVKKAHDLGFKVLIDWVANHTGWDHKWTREYPEYYRRNLDGNFYDSNGWEDVIDLNYDNPALRKTMIESMRFWVNECDIDGFRCDMAMLVPLDFWKEARALLDADKKLFWLAECEEIDYHQVFDASYAWKFLHKMEAYWKQHTDMHGLNDVLQYYSDMFPSTAFRALFTTNHDENSHSGSEYERLGESSKAFALLCSTWNGIPLIYSGQELPNRKRLKFFDKDQIDWNGSYELHDFFKTILHLRKNNPALRAGDVAVKTYRLHTDADHMIFSYLRRNENHEVLVILNLSGNDWVTFELKDKEVSGTFKEIFTGEEKSFTFDRQVEMSAWGYKLYEKIHIKD